MSRNKGLEIESSEGTVMFLIRQKFWQSLETFCDQAYNKTSDPYYVFWKAFSYNKLGNANDAIN